jgi:hypothetical protein
MHLRFLQGGHLPDSLGYQRASAHGFTYFLVHVSDPRWTHKK